MRHGFTLIELLVVITIIVVLLALLMPALDRAVYQAELAACGANLHAIGAGAGVYASSFKSSYPVTKVARLAGGNAQVLNDWNGGFDLRPIIQGFIALKTFVDPLAGKISLGIEDNKTGARSDGLGSVVWANYLWYFNWGYPGEEKMSRLGRQFTWQGDRFNILAADADVRHTAPWLITTHPDSDGREFFQRFQDEVAWLKAGNASNITASWWVVSGPNRGAVDHNYLIDDGSVRRINAVKQVEPGMAMIPDIANASNAAVRQVQLPPMH